MEHESDGTRIDARLREALEPRPEAVERIARNALNGDTGDTGDAGERLRRRALRLAPAVPVLAALALVVAVLVLRDRPAPRRAAVSIENVGEVLVVRRLGGSGSLIHEGEAGGGSPPSGSVIVIYGGE